MLILLMGISGSGKSTVAKALCGDVTSTVVLGDSPLGRRVTGIATGRRLGDTVIGSADTYFVGPDGVYRHDAAFLGRAHGECLRYVVGALERESSLVIVDNTNTSLIECAPYIALGQAYEQEVVVLVLNVSVGKAIERNVHQVPEAGIAAQAGRLVKTLMEWPPWWPRPEMFEA